MNHLPDTGKMVSDTPRTDVATWHTKTPGDPIGSDVVCQSFAEALERELNAANQRIKRLEEALGCVVASCACLHHPKKYQHKFDEACPVEVLIRKAMDNKP